MLSEVNNQPKDSVLISFSYVFRSKKKKERMLLLVSNMISK